MKTSIPSDVWEKKKALIAKLYKDEEWPLKQVIKKIRSDSFNPRLKKWRVTKPSRQTRKKSPDGQSKSSGDESGNEGSSPKAQTSSNSPRTPSQPIQQRDVKPAAYAKIPAPVLFDNQSLSETWALPAGQQPSPCPSEQYGSPNGSPAVSHPHPYDAVFVSQTPAMTHAYNGAPFAVTDAGMQEPVSSTATTVPMQWPLLLVQWLNLHRCTSILLLPKGPHQHIL
ncbi:Clr5 domain-containing protein [Aspergillus clavatus NRRL 1]|uniref:Clr5 domain-containing protein n=1 Tax=Aspergillus clavatus (strain ATCC 1007 / CBS 513.65 / DSM 816 / NCTC 3887 / NRRL 1 / QM 1276 / 107) TaxID=344612 RepID=A1CG00_ASPCL|nr:uncharacterized protein ACLA_065120 [Aspergillus clavatus NRRL 1]EAW10880.1 hypothetical protein ACLA_065120 [Aspergillus clavatus NRRL 1]